MHLENCKGLLERNIQIEIVIEIENYDYSNRFNPDCDSDLDFNLENANVIFS